MERTQNYQSGDLIFRKGNGIFSQYFANAGSKEKVYSHVGILRKEGDSTFVYHIEADEFTGEGNILKEPLNSFLNKVKHYSIRNLNVTYAERDAIIHQADSLLKMKVPFDMDFDASTTDKFYCTELAAYILNSSVKNSNIQPTLVLNHKKYYSVDDLYYSKIVKN